MKKFIFLFTFFNIYFLFAGAEQQPLKEANQLIEQKKYHSAYKVLDDFDPNNQNADILLLKEHIVLKYFLKSINHQMFGLMDLQPEDDLMDLRGKPGSFDMIVLPVDSLLIQLIGKTEDNCKLKKGLGEFYFDVYYKYPDNWLISSEDILQRIESNFNAVIAGNCADYKVYFNLGLLKNSHGKFKESENYYKKSIELNDNNADSYYNLAYAQLNQNDRDNSIVNATKAFDLYKGDDQASYKSDASRLIATCYLELGDTSKGIKYYEKAYDIDPKEYNNQKPLLELYLKKDDSKSKKICDEIFEADPENPNVCNDLADIYILNKRSVELIDFFKAKVKTFEEEDADIKANLYLFIGKLYHSISNNNEARNYIEQSKAIFIKKPEKNKNALQTIEDSLKELKN